MSGNFIAGFFLLADPQRSAVKRSGTESTSFVIYTTAIQCTLFDHLIPADLRVFTRTADAPLLDNTIAWVVAKASFPSNERANLDAIICKPFGGDPNAAGYEENVPDFAYPLVFGIGTVLGAHQVLTNQDIVWDVSTSQYVRESVKVSTIQ